MSDSNEHVDDKLRLLTYSRHDFRQCCIDTNTLREKCPLDNFGDLGHSKAAASSNLHVNGAEEASTKPGWRSLLDRLCDPTAVLGSLDILPPELLQEILYSSDLRSLTNLRAINKRARSIIDSLPRYQAITEYVPDALRLMLSIGTASYFTISDLHAAFLSQECFVCGNFGGFLCALNCRRCCYYCITYSMEFLPLWIDTARVQCLLDNSSIFRLDVAFSLPGKHGRMRRTVRQRRPLILRSAAEHATIVFHEAETKNQTSIINPVTKREIKYLERLLHSSSNMRGLSDRELWQMIKVRDNGPTHHTIVPFPILQASTKELEWGLACQACQPIVVRSEVRESLKLFTKTQYLQHFDQCEPAKKRWQKYILPDHGRMEEIFWKGTEIRQSTIIPRTDHESGWETMSDSYKALLWGS